MQKTQQLDPIAAISTGVGASVGIIRLSGSGVFDIADKVFRAKSGKKISGLAAYRAAYGHIIDEGGSFVDEAIALVMRSPRSYTAEDTVELQCHGGAAVLKKTLALVYRAGARPAEGGEFTKRAFLNGRLDLTAAQSVMDVVSAKTDLALKAAEDRLSGRLSMKIKSIRDALLDLITHLAALVDFPDDDVEEITARTVKEKISPLIAQTEELIRSAPLGIILREGLLTAIIGKPNVGKSSLLNLLAGVDRAIVTDIPGTTRDGIEETVELGGIPLRLIDTAGIRETADAVEKIGVARAKDYAAKAQLILAMFDGSRPWDDDDEAILRLAAHKPTIVLLNKRDLPTAFAAEKILAKMPDAKLCRICAHDTAALDVLAAAVLDLTGAKDNFDADAVLVAEETQLEKLKQTKEHLTAALDAIEQELGWDFVTIDLRSAWEILGEISGDQTPDEIIDEIFARFCIGK